MGLLLKLNQRLAQGFSGFWARWPRKHARKDANKAWEKLNPDHELEKEIHAALDWQIPIFEQRDPQYIPLAATWLRGERWTDEPPAPPKPKTPPPSSLSVRQQAEIDVAREQFRKTEEVKRLIAAGMSRDEAFRQVWK